MHLAVFDALSPAAPRIRSALISLPASIRGFAGQLPASDVCIVAMPQLSPTMTHGNVRKWAKGEGEPLEQYELLFDLDTDSLTEDAYKVGDFEGKFLAMGTSCQVQPLPCVWSKRIVPSVHSCMPTIGIGEASLWASVTSTASLHLALLQGASSIAPPASVMNAGTTTMQIECIEEGFLAKILVPEGSDQVPVGTPIALMCEDEAEIKSVAEHKISKDVNQYAEGGNKPGYKFMTWQSYLRERKPDSKGGEGCIV